MFRGFEPFLIYPDFGTRAKAESLGRRVAGWTHKRERGRKKNGKADLGSVEAGSGNTGGIKLPMQMYGNLM